MNEDRDAYIGSRDHILDRSWVTELWMRVLQKAIDDLATFIRMEEDGEKISEEDWIYGETAHGFLFDPDYRINLDDKEVSLSDLLGNWDCLDVDVWREMTRQRICDLVEDKRKALHARRYRDDTD